MRDVKEYWNVDTFALVFVMKTAECNNVKVPSISFFHVATNKASLATLTPNRLSVTLLVKDSWSADTNVHLCVAFYAKRFYVKRCVKKSVCEVMRANNSATLVCHVVIAW